MPSILQRVAAFSGEIIAWRREIHRFPELGYEERKTSEFVFGVLQREGIRQVRTGVAGYGLVADIDGGTPGGTIGIRADMDALPIAEEVDSDFASEYPGRMHACGHDAHTAMLLGAARILKAMADAGELAGNVRLIFQPSEEMMDKEGKSGGRRMVEEGVLDGLSALLGQHVNPLVEAGKISFQSGITTASSDSFEIIVRGESAHAAMPHHGADSIVAAAALIQGIQQIVSRRIDPANMGVITIGTVRGGTASNILAETVEMSGTVRAFDEATRRLLIQELGSVCRIAEAMGSEARLTITEGYPPVYNDPDLTALAERAIRKQLGDEAIHPPLGPSTGAEDFAFMSREVPGTMMSLGVKDPRWAKPSPAHTPAFQIDERALTTGAAALAIAASEYLRSRWG